FTDAGQVLDGNAAPGALGGVHDALADDVVGVGAKARLLAGDAPQFLLRPFGVPSLQSLSLQIVLAADVLHRLSRVGGAVAVYGNLYDAKIDPEMVGGWSRFGRLVLDLDMQEVAAVAALDERGAGGLAALQSRSLVRAQDGFDAPAGAEQGQGE